jgi:hypothetical protein
LNFGGNFPDVEKLGLGFPELFLRFDANRVFENAHLNRGNPYLFFFKKLLLFTFFQFLSGNFEARISRCGKISAWFSATFFVFRANRVFHF